MLGGVKRTKCFTMFDPSNVCGRSKFYHTRSSTINHDQSRFPNGTILGKQAMFDRLSPNISRLDRTLNRDALWPLILLVFNLCLLQFFP